MLVDLAINIFSALLGFALAQLYMFVRKRFARQAIISFWAPIPADKIVIFCGGWEKALSEFGELELVLNAQVAFTLAELKRFLESLYSEVVITADMNSIDWRYPVVSLGGPLPNLLTKEIGDQGLLPIWFQDMPYSKTSRRSLGNAKKSESFTSEFGNTGQLVSDVGFIARLKVPEKSAHFLYVIAGNYGGGNWGVVRHMTSPANLKQLGKISKGQRLQAIIRSRIAKDEIQQTKLINCRDLD